MAPRAMSRTSPEASTTVSASTHPRVVPCLNVAAPAALRDMLGQWLGTSQAATSNLQQVRAMLDEVTTQVGRDPSVQWQLQLDGWHPRASTLAQALWIACGDLVRRDGELRLCVECGRWMEIGPGAFSKNRQLCLDACKFTCPPSRAPLRKYSAPRFE